MSLHSSFELARHFHFTSGPHGIYNKWYAVVQLWTQAGLCLCRGLARRLHEEHKHRVIKGQRPANYAVQDTPY